MSAPGSGGVDLGGVRCLVVGADGFIGRWVLRHLVAARADVYAGVRDAALAAPVLDAYGIEADVLEADLAAEGSAAELVARVRPTVVFNLVGYGIDPRERDEALSRRLNVDLAAELVDAVADVDVSSWSGPRLVHVGSAAEYGDASGDLDEEGPALPTTTYGRTKLAGTEAVRRRAEARGVAAVTARLFTVYGPGERPARLVPSLIAAASSDDPIDLTAGLQPRDFTYVDDAAEGLVRLAASRPGHGTAVNLTTGTLTTVREFVERAARVLEIEPGRLRFGALPTRQEEMEHDPPRIDRVRGLLGWSPGTTIEAGIRKTFRAARAGRSGEVGGASPA